MKWKSRAERNAKTIMVFVFGRQVKNRDLGENSNLLISFSLKRSPRMLTRWFILCACTYQEYSLWSVEYDLQLRPKGRPSFSWTASWTQLHKGTIELDCKKLWSPHRGIPVADKFPVSSLKCTLCLLLIYLWHAFFYLL